MKMNNFEFKNDTTIFYHKNCTDGFMSAYLLYRAYKALGIEGNTFVAVNYNEVVPEVKTKTLLIVDFSFSRNIIDEFIEQGIDVHMYDHHLTAAEQHGGYGRYTCQGFNCCIEEHKSGAGLVLDLIEPIFTNKQHEFLLYEYLANRVEDRDLWKFNYTDTKAVYELLNSVPFTFEDWDNLTLSSDLFSKLEEFKIRVTFREQLAKEYAAKAKIIRFQNYDVPCVNVPANFSSEVGDILGKEYPFAIMYVVGDIVYMSLRSNKQTGIDTSTISKQFKGGGHINASGFKLEVSQLVDLLSGKL